MSLLSDPPFALGQTLGVSSASDGGNWVGVVKVFPDVNPTTGVVRSNRLKKCIAVRNASGVVLLPKRMVAWKSGSFTQVDGYTNITDEASAGIVDEHIPASGVAANDVFWVTVEGPTEVKLAPGLTAAVDTYLTAVTAANSLDATTAGQAQTAAATWLQNGFIGRAVSSGSAGANVLTVVNIVRS